MRKKIKKIFKKYREGYFPNEKDCDICAFTIPVLELLEKDIVECVNSEVNKEGDKK